MQSCFANVSRGFEVTTSEDSVLKFLALEPNFGITALSDVNLPWLSVNFFQSAEILKNLDPTGSCQRDLQSRSKMRGTVPMESPKTIHFLRGRKRGRYQTSSRDRPSFSDSLEAGTSKSSLYIEYNYIYTNFYWFRFICCC